MSQISFDESSHITTQTEEAAVDCIMPALYEKADALYIDRAMVKSVPRNDYTSLFLSNKIIVRISIRRESFSVEVPSSCKGFLPCKYEYKKNGDFFRFSISLLEELAELRPFFAQCLECISLLFPIDFDCCSRYERCSDAKGCVHPDKALAFVCGYRRILNKGRIFYGVNRNVD